jgi:hypothetical protein
MKTIELEIEDSNFETFKILIDSLKEGIVKNFKVKESIEEVSDEEQHYYEELLSNRTPEDKEVAFRESFEI